MHEREGGKKETTIIVSELLTIEGAISQAHVLSHTS